MNKNSIINSRSSPLEKTGYAHCNRVRDPLHKMLLFSTPLLHRKALVVPAKRPGNDAVELTGRIFWGYENLERSYSLNVKTRRDVAVNYGHNWNDRRKPSCLLPATTAAPFARYNVRPAFLYGVLNSLYCTSFGPH